jgi:hypothetical protein
MVANPKLAADDHRDALGGPDVATEAERFSPAREQAGQTRSLLVRQLRRRAGRHPSPQSLDSALATAPHPLADRSGRHPQCVGNRLLRPAMLFQFPRSQPPPFSPITGCSLFCDHAAWYCTTRAVFSNRHGGQ